MAPVNVIAVADIPDIDTENLKYALSGTKKTDGSASIGIVIVVLVELETVVKSLVVLGLTDVEYLLQYNAGLFISL